MDLFNLVARLTLDTSEYEQSLDQSETQASGFGKKLKGAFGVVGKAGAGLAVGAAAAGAAIFGMATKSAQASDHIDKMSQKLGLSREAYQELDFIASQSGTDVDSLRGGMKALTTQMDSAMTGTGKAADAFKSLGISVTDSEGNMKSQEQMLWETLAALQNMEDGTEKATIANQLFGRSGSELMPLINGAAGSIDAMRQQAHDLGLVMSDETIDAGVKFTDSMDQVKRSLSAIGTKIGAEVMPIVQKALDFILEHMPEIQAVAQTVFSAIGSFVNTFIGVINSTLVPALSGLINFITSVFAGDWSGAWEIIKSAAVTIWNAIGSAISTPIEAAKTALLAIADAIGTALSTAWDGIKTTASTVWEGIKTTATTVWEAIKTAVTTPIETAKTTLGTIVETISTALSTAWDGIKTTASTVWDAIKTAVTTPIETAKTAIGTTVSTLTTALSTAWNGIKTTASTLWEAIKTAVTTPIDAAKTAVGKTISLLTSALSTAWNGIKTTATTLWDAIKSAVTTPIDAAKTAVGKTIATLTSAMSTAWDTIKSTATTLWNSIKSAVTTPIENAKTAVGTAVSTLTTSLSTAWNSIKSTATTLWNSVKSAITTPITSARDKVKEVIDKIKGFFNFKISWPHIPMPKFSITPPGWHIGDLLKGKIPKLGITWEKKAYDLARMFTEPTVLGTPQGLYGFGDGVGGEIVMSDKKLRKIAGGQETAAAVAYLTEVVEELGNSLTDKMAQALMQMGFKIDGREFARLVRDVRTA